MIEPRLFRIAPKMDAASYKTYGLVQPLSTHTRPATCSEVECKNRERGWKTIIDVGTALGAKQANYIRLQSGRAFTHSATANMVTFTFAAGQDCFTAHRVSLHRTPIFNIKGGDWRGNPLGLPTQVLRPEAWRDDFGEHQERIAEQTKRG